MQYNEGGTITLDKTTYTGPKTVYAVWKQEAAPTDPVYTWDDNLKYMQQMTSEACAAAPSKTPKTLTDSRDGSTYTVAKLDDDKCWMTQNLRITGDSIKAKDPSNTTGTITSADSNVSSNYNIPASSSDGWGTSGYMAENLLYDNNETHGAYYTWCAATAGTCSGAENNTEAKASGSICPRGWRLPTPGEYDTLLSKDGGWGTKNDVNGRTLSGGFFPAAGVVHYGSLQYVGSQGGDWSSTAGDNNRAYYLFFASSNVNTFDNGTRYLGFSVRCIAE